MALNTRMTEKEDFQLPLSRSITDPVPHSNARTARYIAAKIVAIVLAITIFVYTYHSKWHIPFAPAKEPVPQFNNPWLNHHPKIFLPNSEH
jgi:hypothetical protein